MRAAKLTDEERFGEARTVLVKAQELARQHGIKSARLSSQLADCFYMLDEIEDALRACIESLELDPFQVYNRNAFNYITQYARTAIRQYSPVVRAFEPLYELLCSCDAADDLTHVAAARWFFEMGDVERARRILDAVTLLSPACAPAWTALAVLARAEGDEECAVEFEFEALSLETAMKAKSRSPQARA